MAQRWVVVGLLLALLVACSSSGQEQDPEPQPLEGATVTLLQYTHDQVNRNLVVKVAAGEETVQVEGVEVLTGAFTGTDRADVAATIPPGGDIDLRVPLGDPDCSLDLRATDVSVRFGTPDGADVTVAPEGADFLADLHARECLAHDAVTAVPLTWAEHWRTTGEGERTRLTARLQVGPVVSDSGDGAARIVALDGSVIFVLRGRELRDGPLSVATGERGALTVEFRPNRCDAHVWETSRGFEFEARLTVPGSSEEVLVPVVPPRDKQQLLSRTWRAQCGVAAPG